MEKRTKILVPVDFSDCSANALTYAIRLADKINASLQVLHVPPLESGMGENPTSFSIAIQERVSQSREQMNIFTQDITDKVRSHLKKIPSIQTRLELGKVGFTINSVAAINDIDFIIMGTQGERNTLTKYLGSLASNIVKNAPCSVIVIPEKAEFSESIELGYATDFSDVDPVKIRRVVELFKPFKLEIKCIHFNKKQVYKVDEIKKFKAYFAENVPELNMEFYNLPVDNTVKYMNYFIEKQNINMLVMYRPKRTFFESIFHTSYTQQMAKHVNIPLLVLKKQ